MEIADAIVINKADGSNMAAAELARQQYSNALHIMRPKSPNWSVPVLTCSALKDIGIDNVWETLEEYRTCMRASGEFEEKRRQQAREWMWTLLQDDLRELFIRDKNIAPMLAQVEQSVIDGRTTPGAASRRLLERFRRH